ncbi:MAG: hypothetical protein K1W28_02650 [Lachnospiraceae bacterium]
MNKNEHTATMYESIPAVAELNKVPGFNPLKLLRRVISPDNGEMVLQLDLPYKKLWFRLANPKGRIRLNALRITEQMAIYEAQVFLERTDENPIGSFTSSCTKEEAPGGHYIQAAQQAAMDEALSDAGFGIQFADVNMGAEGSRYGSRIPLNGTAQGHPLAAPAGMQKASGEAEQSAGTPAGGVVRPFPTATGEKELQKPAQESRLPVSGGQITVNTKTEEKKSSESSLPVNPQADVRKNVLAAKGAELPVNAPEAKSLPIQAGTETPKTENTEAMENSLPVSERKSTEEDTQKAVQGMMSLLGGSTLPFGTTVSSAETVQTKGTVSEGQNLPAGGNAAPAVPELPTDGKPASGTMELPVIGETVQEKTTARYTPDMPVEEIVRLMTFEEAGQVVVDTGVCKGQTIAEVAERRPPSLKFYLYGGYKGDNNILRAAAQIMLDSLAVKKAG